MNCFDLIWAHLNSPTGYRITQKFARLDAKRAFRGIETQFVLP